MARMRRQNSSRSNGRTRKFRNSLATLRTQLRVESVGKPLLNAPDPRTFISAPWNTVRLSMLSISDSPDDFTARVTVGNVQDYLVSQLNLPALTPDNQPQFRVKSVRAWLSGLDGTNNTNNGYLRLNCTDLIMANNNTNEVSLKTVEDLPGKNHWANVGFVWPQDHTNTVFASNSNIIPLFALSWRNAGVVRMHLDVLWRYVPPGSRPAIVALKPERSPLAIKWLNDDSAPMDVDE